ncbi:MAG: biopolymer transporter ExbD [Nitrosomonas sp.]|nr:MAG: biopolymer transporter ExbD [Nitrosomonas sp.]
MVRRRIRIPHSEPAINLTPLIDVVFVILIVFLVAAPLLELEQVDIASAPPHQVGSAQSVQASSPVTVYVHRDDTVWFDGQQRDMQELIVALREAHQRHPLTAPQLVQDRRSQLGTYQQVKNAFESAGYHELELILRPGG